MFDFCVPRLQSRFRLWLATEEFSQCPPGEMPPNNVSRQLTLRHMRWVEELGLPVGELSYELVDEDGEPVALLLNEGQDLIVQVQPRQDCLDFNVDTPHCE